MVKTEDKVLVYPGIYRKYVSYCSSFIYAVSFFFSFLMVQK